MAVHSAELAEDMEGVGTARTGQNCQDPFLCLQHSCLFASGVVTGIDAVAAGPDTVAGQRIHLENEHKRCDEVVSELVGCLTP